MHARGLLGRTAAAKRPAQRWKTPIRRSMAEQLAACLKPVADAAERGDLQAVKAWLARPFSRIDAVDNHEWTLLHHTCLTNPPVITADHEALAEYLLSRGASVNHGDASVLHCAVARHSSHHPTDMVGLPPASGG